MFQPLIEIPALAVAIAGVFGLLVGSFLNVVILRLPARMEWQWRRECREMLAEYEASRGVGEARVDREGPPTAVSAVEAHAAPRQNSAEAIEPSGACADCADNPGAAQAKVDAGAGDVGLVDGSMTVVPGEPAPVSAADGAAQDPDPAPPGIVVESSHCPKCGFKLKPWHNIPVLSWLALRGRCAGCGSAISLQYPLVELLTGLAFAAVVWQFGIGWTALAGLVFTGLLIAMSGIDARTTLLPDSLTLPLLWIGLLASTFGWTVPMEQALWGAAVGYLSLWSVFWAFKLLTGKDGMGQGDFKLLAALGAWCGLESILPIVLISASLGAIIGSLWLAARGRDHATPIPFGPFLALAGWVYFLFGAEIQSVYLGLVQIG